MRPNAQPPRIVIVLTGGEVQDVFSDMEGVRFTIINEDEVRDVDFEDLEAIQDLVPWRVEHPQYPEMPYVGTLYVGKAEYSPVLCENTEKARECEFDGELLNDGPQEPDEELVPARSSQASVSGP